jgi:thymidine kinase
MNRGKLILIIGPMKSGKSSELMRMLRIRRVAKKRIFALKHAIAKGAHHGADLLKSRDGSEPVDAIEVDKLAEFSLEGVEDAVIGVDEGQFFQSDELLSFCRTAVRQRNLVIVAALNGDSEGCAWPSISALIPFCKDIKPFTAVCEFCGQDAQMTFRCGSSIEQIDVEAEYKPACEECWDTQTTLKIASCCGAQ